MRYLTLVTAAVIVLGDCNSCAEYGQCKSAYNFKPGHFCGHWGGVACCCPDMSECIPRQLTCECLPLQPLTAFTTEPAKINSEIRAGGLVAVFLWLCCFFGVYTVCYRKFTLAYRRHRQFVSIPTTRANIYHFPIAHAARYPQQPIQLDPLLPIDNVRVVIMPSASRTPPRWSQSHVTSHSSRAILALPKIRE